MVQEDLSYSFQREAGLDFIDFNSDMHQRVERLWKPTSQMDYANYIRKLKHVICVDKNQSQPVN